MNESTFGVDDGGQQAAQVPGRLTTAPCVMVILGASGDLTERKLIPSLFDLERDGLLADEFTIVGFARTDMSTDQFRRQMLAGVKEHGGDVDEHGEMWQRFVRRLIYVSGQYDDLDSHRRLRDTIARDVPHCKCRQYLYYMSLPPSVSERALECMKQLADESGGQVQPCDKPAGPVHAAGRQCTPDRVHDHERYRSTVKRLHRPAGPVHAAGRQCTPDRVHDHERYRSTVKRLHRLNNAGTAGTIAGVSRVVMEKPFGVDLDSARQLNERLQQIFSEKQVYRVDHYLAKDTIRNLMVFRFGNAIFEPLWNRNNIDNVQITAAESIGIEGRGGYYEESGVLRDMVQNHVLNVLTLIAMEAPVAGDAESVRDRMVDVLKSMNPIEPGDAVFGQYRGYRDERNVAADSSTPTFVAMRTYVNNWRWQGVPFYLRSGKALAKKVTEVIIQFKHVPACVLEDQGVCPNLTPNVLILRIQPDEGIRLRFTAKTPGRDDQVASAYMDFRYDVFGVKLAEAYGRIIYDCLRGVPTTFLRADQVDQAWRVVSPVLDASHQEGSKYPNYEPGTWGPSEADALLARYNHRWHESY